MTVPAYFSATYAKARSKFLKACEERGFNVESHHNDRAKGAEGEDLYMDVVRIGPDNTSKVLFISSATHGGEGFCGSGVQVGMLEEGYFNDLPEDTAVILIHAINPYGFSHVRRVNEDNVDLNRNFLDYSQGLPDNSDYAEVHDMLVPDDWHGPAYKAAQSKIDAYVAERGLGTFQAAVTGGQHIHSDGLFFGGFKPTWTNDTLRAVSKQHAGNSKHLALLDFHTGLGPYGHGELIYVGDPTGLPRAMSWYGDDVTSPEAGTSSSAIVRGTIDGGVCDMAPNASHTCVAIEYGTLPVMEVLESLRADNWLYLKGDISSEQGKAIKKQIRDAFYGDADDWKNMIWERGTSVVKMALEGLREQK
ncbi:MAG: M14 family metallopeptidase [Proteobacteria bacterium]|nr:M14 family metallopeptidase [Pseudomonadota bacterium]